jgi:hypothetical protein
VAAGVGALGDDDVDADLDLQLAEQLTGVAEVRAFVLGGHDDIDSVRLAADVVVDPVELGLQLFGREVERAEDAHAAGAADRGDDVAAVAESEDRILDAEEFRYPCPHSPDHKSRSRN